MRAFNKRKTSNEVRLFLTRGKKLSFTRHEEYETYCGEKNMLTETGVFKIRRKEKIVYIIGGFFKMRSMYNSYSKFLKNNGTGFMINNFEKLHNVKIEDLGLKRIDFSIKKFSKNCEKIVNALNKYKEKNK